MRNKLRNAIDKLNNTVIYPQLTYIFYNAYLIKSVYFGIGIICLTPNQELELMRIYEPTILRKLNLSSKLPRRILYTRKLSLGIGIMKPSTIIDTLKAKLYLENVRKEGVAQSAIRLQEEYLAVEAGRRVSIPHNPEERYWQ